MIEVSRISTGIDELDKTLSGGLIPGSVYLISGDIGMGKTITAFQFLLHGIKNGEKVAIITDTSQDNIIEDMRSLELDVEGPIKDRSLLIISLHDQFEDLKNKVIAKKEDPKKILTKFLSEINSIIKHNDIKRLVIDPITQIMIPSPYMYAYVKTLITGLDDASCTTVITSEVMSPNALGIEEHVSGVVLLSYGNSLTKSRFFSIKKMRGTDCSPILHEFVIKPGIGICGTGHEILDQSAPTPSAPTPAAPTPAAPTPAAPTPAAPTPAAPTPAAPTPAAPTPAAPTPAAPTPAAPTPAAPTPAAPTPAAPTPAAPTPAAPTPAAPKSILDKRRKGPYSGY